MPSDTFLDRPRSPFATSVGEIDLPFLARDASLLAAFFRVSSDRAEAALADGPFAPVRTLAGGAVAAVGFIDYRDTTIGPYVEALVALAVVPRGTPAPALPLLALLRPSARRSVGFHILDVPVTGHVAEAGGRELWGFPKFVTRVALDLGAGTHRARGVIDAPSGDDPIVVLEAHSSVGVPLPAMDLVFFSVLAGAPLRTVVNMRGVMHTSLGRGLTVRIGRGVHPMADRLDALGLADARPLAAQVCHHLQLVLHPGAPVALARAA